jgi:hypothetical protein
LNFIKNMVLIEVDFHDSTLVSIFQNPSFHT